jgi:hypothetical protein
MPLSIDAPQHLQLAGSGSTPSIMSPSCLKTKLFGVTLCAYFMM